LQIGPIIKIGSTEKTNRRERGGAENKKTREKHRILCASAVKKAGVEADCKPPLQMAPTLFYLSDLHDLRPAWPY
jgi:hypothetical protein